MLSTTKINRLLSFARLDGNIFNKLKLRLEDFARTHNASRLLSFAQLIKAFNKSGYQRLEALSNFTVANESPRWLVNSCLAQAKRVASSLPISSPESIKLHRSIIVKEPVSEEERGILVVSFEYELAKLVLLENFTDIEKRYQIVFMPTWQPLHSAPLFMLSSRATKDFFVLPSTQGDSRYCSGLSKFCRYLPFNAASWVNSELYPECSTRTAKDIDIVMLANFAIYKRHWRLFEALQDLPQDLKVVLMGVPIGNRTRDALLAEARWFGTEDRFELLENPDDDIVVDRLSRAKIACALSHREGSYVAVAENIMAGTPVGMYADARIGTKALINEQTGYLFNPKAELSQQILFALEESTKQQPQSWAKAKNSAQVNSQSLNAHLKSYSEQNNQPWTSDLSGFYAVRFDFFYLDGNDREEQFKPLYQQFSNDFGVEIHR